MPAAISARTASAAAAAADSFRSRDRLGCLGLRGHGAEQCAGFGGLRRRNHLSRLLDRRDLGAREQPGLGGEETLAQQCPAGLGDRVEEWLRPAVLNEQERKRRPRRQGFCQCPRVRGIEARRALARRWFHQDQRRQAG